MNPAHLVQEAGDRFPTIEDDARLSAEDRDGRLAGTIMVAEHGRHKATVPWPLAITPDEALAVLRLYIADVYEDRIRFDLGCRAADVADVRRLVGSGVLAARRMRPDVLEGWLRRTLESWRERYEKAGVRLEAANA